MHTDQKRVTYLIAFVQGLMKKEDGKELYLKYKSEIEQVTPQEAFEVFHSLLQNGAEPKEILPVLDKAINAFYKSLFGYSWKKPEKDTFMDILIQENHALMGKFNLIKDLLTDKRAFEDKKKELFPLIRELQEFDAHYVKKENILFPYMEKKMKKFDGLAIMWALHEEIRSSFKIVNQYMEHQSVKEKDFNAEFGNLLFVMRALVKKEELILFPAASEVILEDEWNEMQKQSFEYGFPFIEQPENRMGNRQELSELAANLTDDYLLNTETGVLNVEQIQMIFNTLPMDLTFVDENNKVKYFTGTKDRIFPRSPAIVGRDVEKCHPPESVHTVLEITESFRSGKQNHANFWIKMKGRRILIQYFALRDSSGNYKGVLEATQDITDISKLEGERRLLHWESGL